MSSNSIKRALIIVDNQVVFRDVQYFGVARSNPNYERNIVTVLEAFRKLEPKVLIIHVQHHSLSQDSPFHPSKPSSRMESSTQPMGQELVVTKNVNSAFIGTNLEQLIRDDQIEKLYITGITTDHCVSTTTRMAANLGVTNRTKNDGTTSKGEVVLVQDATACFQKYDQSWDAETVHGVNVESLREFASIATTEEVLQELSTLDR